MNPTATQPRSIFQSMTSMFNSAAGAVEHITAAASESAETLEVLARTGKSMAVANENYMLKRTNLNHARKIYLLENEATMFALELEEAKDELEKE